MFSPSKLIFDEEDYDSSKHSYLAEMIISGPSAFLNLL